jgi:hypothetical protein
VKTGRLLKFRRGGAEIHAYVYQDGRLARAALYVTGPGLPTKGHPDQELSAATEAEVESAVHAWVDRHHPR